MTPTVALHDVVRRYGDVAALDGVDLSIEPGELVGMLGPNGAGKSTLINLILGLRRPHSGTVEVLGGSPHDPSVRVNLGCTPQETALPANLRVGEVVQWVSGHYPDPIAQNELLERFGLAELADRQTGGLSGGQRRKLSVALALVGRPRLVVLDEPTTGLDISARHELWDALRETHRQGTTILVTSHYLEEIEALAQRVVVLHHGRVLVDDTLERVLGTVDVHVLSLRTVQPATLDTLSAVVRHTSERGREWLYVRDSDTTIRELVDRRIPFQDLTVRGASLEEAFQALTAADDGTGARPDGTGLLADRPSPTGPADHHSPAGPADRPAATMEEVR